MGVSDPASIPSWITTLELLLASSVSSAGPLVSGLDSQLAVFEERA